MMPAMAILAGGLATRLRPVTETIPKSLVEVAGKPFLFHQLDLLKEAGLSKLVICAGHLASRIESAVSTQSGWGFDIEFSLDGPTLLGTGGALRKALTRLSDPFWVLYGDSYLPVSLSCILSAFPENALGLMTVFCNENRWDASNIHFSGNRILAYDKRSPTAVMRHIDYGLGLLRKSAFDYAPQDEAFDLSDLYSNLVRQGRMAGWESQERFFEIGSKQGLEELREKLSLQVKKENS